VLSVGSRRSSLSDFQAVGSATTNVRRPYTSWDCVEAQRGDDAWQMKMPSTGHIRYWNAIVRQVPWRLVIWRQLKQRHELEMVPARRTNEVGMHASDGPTAIELSRITNKTCSRIQTDAVTCHSYKLSLRCACQQYITVVDARSNEGMDQRRRWVLWIQWSSDTSQLLEPIKTGRADLRDVLIHGQIWWQCVTPSTRTSLLKTTIYSKL